MATHVGRRQGRHESESRPDISESVNRQDVQETEKYCKTLNIRVTLFLRDHDPWYIHETIFRDLSFILL